MTAGFLIVLPPSETKRDGGNAPFTGALTRTDDGDASGISWPEFESLRNSVAGDLIELASDPEQSARALKISARLAQLEANRNAQIRRAPRMPAVLRYTGVLYDALDAESLESGALAWIREHVAVHSALYGLVGGGEAIAAYRCSADSRLPGSTLRARWSRPIADALREHSGTILDLRSSGYIKLGPAPHAVTVDIVSRSSDGVVRALNHFNKRAKGELTRRLAEAGARSELPDTATRAEIVAVMRSMGFDAREGAGDGRIVLLVEHPARTGGAIGSGTASR